MPHYASLVIKFDVSTTHLIRQENSVYYFGENIIIAQIMLFKIIIIKYHKPTYTHILYY